MSQSTSARPSPSVANKSLLPPARRASRRSMITAGILGTLLLLVPVPQLLAQNHILTLPFSQLYNQAIINAAADTGAFVMLALGLNIVVGYAGLLDLGYAAFFAIGSYTYALLASPQFSLHFSFWLLLLVAPVVAAFFGVLLGAPTLRLRGDYLAIVTLGFGEIVPSFFLNAQSITGGTNGIPGVETPVLGIPLTNIGFGFGLGGNNPYPYYYL